MGLLSNFIKDRGKRIYKQHKAIYNKRKRTWLQAIGLGCNRKILTFKSCARHEERGKDSATHGTGNMVRNEKSCHRIVAEDIDMLKQYLPKHPRFAYWMLKFFSNQCKYCIKFEMYFIISKICCIFAADFKLKALQHEGS